MSMSKDNAVLPIKATYFRETIRALSKIQKAHLKFREDPRKSLGQIKHAAGRIADLAMIHGYDGVENIADKLCHTIDSALKSQGTLDRTFDVRIEFALKVIRKIVELETVIESRMTVERLDHQVVKNYRKIAEYTKQWTDERPDIKADAEESPSRTVDKAWSPVFDINEIDSDKLLGGCTQSDHLE